MVFIAIDVLEVVDSQARHRHVASHENQHAHYDPEQLIILDDDSKELAQRGMFGFDHNLLTSENQRDRLEDEHDGNTDGGESQPALLLIAERLTQRLGYGQYAYDYGKQTDIRENPSESTDLLTFFLILRQTGQHGVIGDVVDGVGHLIGEIDDGEDQGESCPGGSGIDEHANGSQPPEQGTSCNPGFELAPARLRVVDDHAHDRIVEGIKDSHRYQDCRYSCDFTTREIQDLSQVEHQVHRDQRANHVAPQGTQPETQPVPPTIVHEKSFTPKSSFRLADMVFDPTLPLGTDFTAAISAKLSEFLDQTGQRLEQIDPSLDFAADLARLFTQGGKRLRPAFCYWSYVAAAGQPEAAEELLKTSASLDLLHVGILIHDDVMDGSDVRRGIPAAHRQFEAAHRAAGGVGDSAAYGRAAAIQLGNLLQAWSIELAEPGISEAVDPTSCRRVLDFVREEVIAGQFLDLAAQNLLLPGDPSAIAEQVVEQKTSRYTIQRPAAFGARLGNGSNELVSALESFGLPLGRAFQYRDDLLGVFGDEAVTGKTSGDDLKEGKRTLLLAEASKDVAAAEVLRVCLGKPEALERLDEIRELIVASGAVERVEKRIADDHAAALDILAATEMSEDGRIALTKLADLAVHRQF